MRPMTLSYKQVAPLFREARTPLGSYFIKGAPFFGYAAMFANGAYRDCGSVEEAERINQEHFDAAWLACGVDEEASADTTEGQSKGESCNG